MKRLYCALLAGMAIGTPAALADWNPGDPHKMHFPQLPDPFGWDVNMTSPKVLADDWRCSSTGPVSDVHFWYSYRQDQQVPIKRIHLSIHKDVPAGPTNPFSHPGDLLWDDDFLPGEFTTRLYGQGEQGWYDPNTGEAQRPDHMFFYQANIEHILNPFVQQFGTIYWLDISVELEHPSARIGWKTSRDHFNDDAVWGDYPDPQWNELRDPLPPHESLDLAFVITPAPSSAVLLGLSALVAVGRRRRA